MYPNVIVKCKSEVESENWMSNKFYVDAVDGEVILQETHAYVCQV